MGWGGGGRRCQDCTRECAQLLARVRVGELTLIAIKVLTGVGVGVEVATRVLAQPVVWGGVEVAGGHVASHLQSFPAILFGPKLPRI